MLLAVHDLVCVQGFKSAQQSNKLSVHLSVAVLFMHCFSCCCSTLCVPSITPAQVLYKRVCEYLELDTRVEVINTR